MKARLDPIRFGTSGWRHHRAAAGTTDGLKLHLDGGAWVLVRPSGTEPVARLSVEAPDARTLEALRNAALRHFFA